MNGILRYGKSIAASVTLSILALAGNYGQSWLFPVVAPLSANHNVVLMDDVVATSQSQSQSPMRDQIEGRQLKWKVAVVTNREHSAEPIEQASGSFRESRTLSQQTIDAMYSTAETTFGFAEVELPVVRPRGSCVLKKDSEHRLTVHPWKTQAEVSFYAELNNNLRQTTARDVFVFVHGFNVSLEQAVARAAQVSEDMPFDGVVVAFSWQSTGRALVVTHKLDCVFYRLCVVL